MNHLIVFVAQYGIGFSLVLGAYVWLRLPLPGKWEMAALLVFGGILCVVLIKLAGALYYDPRPFVTEHVAPLFAHPADNGFPSEHTALAMFVALCAGGYSRHWSLVLIVVSLLIGIARVWADVHSPLDIVAAVALAAAAVVVARPAARWAVRRLPDANTGR